MRGSIRFGGFLVFIGSLFLFIQYEHGGMWATLSPEQRAELIIAGGVILLGCFALALLSRWFIVNEIIHLTALVVGAGLVSLVLHGVGPDKWESLGFFEFGGPHYQERETTYNNALIKGDKASSIEVAIPQGQGNITVMATNRSDYGIKVKTRVRAWSEDQAKELSDYWHSNFKPSFTADGVSLLSKAGIERGWHSVWVGVEIALPQSASYKINLNSRNGKLKLEKLNATEIVLSTSNGSVEVNQVQAQTIQIISSNGRLEGSLAVGASLIAKTSNGSVDFEVTPTASGRYDLHTSNGRISLELANKKIGYEVSATTSNGRIRIDLPDFIAETKEKRHVAGRTANYYSTTGFQVEISADTSNGSITVK